MGLEKIVMPPIKGLFRVLEKSVLRPDSGLPWDMVRAMIVCEDMKTIMAVLKYIAEYPKIVLLEVNDRFKEDKNGWADCALYITCEDEEYKQFVGEIQIVHRSMLNVREELGAHHVYDECRFGSELLQKIFGKSQETTPWSIRKSGSQFFQSTQLFDDDDDEIN